MTTLTWYGHAALGLETDGHKIIVDPFLNGNPAASISPDAVDRARQRGLNARVLEAGSDYVKKLSRSILSLNLDLADLAPPLIEVAQGPEAGREVLAKRALKDARPGRRPRVRRPGRCGGRPWRPSIRSAVAPSQAAG